MDEQQGTLRPSEPGEGATGSMFEAVHGRRRVKHYLVSAHELASISVMSGAASFFIALGIFLLGAAASIWFGDATTQGGLWAFIALTLGALFLVAATLLLIVRRSDVARIKSETEFPQEDPAPR